MTKISDRFRRRAAAFTDRVEAVPPDRWDDPSPCEDWVARDIIQHMVENGQRFYSLIGREYPPGPSVSDDPVGAWRNARDAIQAALDDPEIAQTEYDGQMGKATFEQGFDRFGNPDLIVHTWDLARATGGDERLDPDEVHQVFEALRPADEMMRRPGVFGPKIEPPHDADEQTQFLAFTGRRV